VSRDGIQGYRTDLDAFVLIAERESWQAPSGPADLDLVLVTATSPPDLIHENLAVNEHGFDPDAPDVDYAAVEAFRPTLVGCAAVTARWAGQAVAAGMYNPIRDGIAELVGITTIRAYRGRGFGGAVTARLTRAAFDAGARTVFLTTDNDDARRVYLRVGFHDLPAT
jgi:predicted GNAT family acetyltransferase